MRKSVIAFALLALVLSGCAGKVDPRQGMSEEWRLRSLEENFLNFKENQRKSEEGQHKLEQRMDALEASMARLQGLAAAGRDFTGARTVASAAAAVPKPIVIPPDRRLYEQGMALVRGGKDAEGRDILNKFLASFPKSAFVPNAVYWIGESHYGERHYAEAILTFKDVARRFPRHPKAADALFKIAMSYRQMGENDNACLYLRALLREHPRSEPSAAARRMLAALGG